MIYYLRSFKKFAIFLVVILHNLLFFFCFRRIFLIVLGNEIGPKTTLHHGLTFFSLSGLKIGANSTVNPGCYLDARGGLVIGNNVNISHDVKIYSMGHNIRSEDFGVFTSSVKIEDNSWIFPNSLIMPGVILREGTIVLPGSVVTKSTQPGSVVGGNPAKLLYINNRDVAYKASFPVHFAK